MVGSRQLMMGVAVAMVAVMSILAGAPAWAAGPIAAGGATAVRPGPRVGQPSRVEMAGGQHRVVPILPPSGSRTNFGPSYPFGYNYTGPTYPFGRAYTGPSYPFGNFYTSPPPVVAAPPPAPRWVQGYWGQQWVPQYYTYDAWIPGYFARTGAWIPGRYEQRTAEAGGYYERVWVEGYWTE